MKTEADGKFICPHCGNWHATATDVCPANGQAIATLHKLVGTTMEGKYKILRVLGEGGMGVVYEATHTLIGRRLAVKVLHPEVGQMSELVERFYNEARTAASIGHEHIIEITDMGMHDASPFIVMEFLEGRPLTDFIQERSLQVEDSVAITMQVLDALNAVHAKGVIHRDLKPDNVYLVNKAGRHFVKLLDFGISKLKTPEAQDMHLTRTGTVLGTPYYMAPEQAAGKKDQDHRIDIYAAGVILYEAVTGNLPYTGDNYNALIAAILTEDAPTPRSYVPELPVELENVILTATAKQPSQRYANATKFYEALKPFAPMWAGRPSKLPGLMQTQGGIGGQPASVPVPLPRSAADDLGSSRTVMAPTPLPGGAQTRSGAQGAAPVASSTGGWSVTADTDVPPPRKRGMGLVIGAVVAVLLLVGAVGSAAIGIPIFLKLKKDRQATQQIVKVGDGKLEQTGPAKSGPAVAGSKTGPDAAGSKTGSDAAGSKTGPDASGTPDSTGPAIPPVKTDAAIAMVKLTLEGLPEGAAVTLDGKNIERFPADLPKSKSKSLLAVKASGYAPWEKTIVLDASKSIKVELQPDTAGKAGGKKTGKKGETLVLTTGEIKPPVVVVEKTPTTPKVTGEKKDNKGIYSGKNKKIELEYPE